MSGVTSRETLMTFATAVIAVSVVAFLLTAGPAVGKTHGLPIIIGEAAFIDISTPASIEIGTPLAIEQDVTESQAADGHVVFSVVISNDSPVESVILRQLVDAEHGDLDGRGDCSVPQVIVAGSAYRCSFS